MPEPIPFLDLRAQHAPLADALREGFARAVQSARFVGGAEVDAFESAFAELCGTPACVGVANGTDALVLALRATGVGPGHVVLVPALTFIATAEAVSLVGATPRFVDIDPRTYTLDPAALRAADASEVRAVIPVHLYGQPADMDAILALAGERGWAVIEDAAQAHGAHYKGSPVGSLAELACFSFYPSKNLGALGDAGAVVGRDLEQLARIRRLSDHGRQTRAQHGEIGTNSRLDAIQAMALRIKLGRLRAWNAARRHVASQYDARLADSEGVTVPAAGPGHVYHLYVVQIPDRAAALQRLGAAGVGAGVHYPLPLPLQPAYAHLGHRPGEFPVAEAVAGRCLSLPIYPELTEPQVDRVVAALLGR